MTLFVVFLTILYFNGKLNSIVEKKNPIMNRNEFQNYYGTSERAGIKMIDAN